MGTVLLPRCWCCGARLSMPMGDHYYSTVLGFAHRPCWFNFQAENRRRQMELAERVSDGSEMPEPQETEK